MENVVREENISKVENKKSTAHRWWTAIAGLGAIILGAWGVMNPISSVIAMTWVFGLVLLIAGITEMVTYSHYKDVVAESSGILINGILTIIIAGILLFTQVTSMVMLATLFAIWFIVDSATWYSMAKVAMHPTLNKVMSIIGIILGIILLFAPALSLGTLVITISASLIIYGAMAIIKAI